MTVRKIQNIKLTGLEVEIWTHNDTHRGHVPCRPLSITIHSAGDNLGKEGSMRLLFSDFEDFEGDYNSQVRGCLVDEHPCECFRTS